MKGIEKSSRVMGLRRFSMVQLLIALALLIFFAPFVEEIKGGALIVSGLLSLVLLSAVLAVASRGRTLAVAHLLAIPAVAGRWLNHFQPHLLPPAIFLVAGIGLVAFVVGNLLRFVLRAPSVDVEVLCASISAYLMLGLIWTMAYWLVDQLTPGHDGTALCGGPDRKVGRPLFDSKATMIPRQAAVIRIGRAPKCFDV